MATGASALTLPALPKQNSKDGERAWLTSETFTSSAWHSGDDGIEYNVDAYTITAMKGKKVVARGSTVKLKPGTYRLRQSLIVTPLDYSYSPSGPQQTLTRTQKMKIVKYNPRCMTGTDSRALRKGWSKSQVAKRFGHRGWQESVHGTVEQRSYRWCDYDGDYYYVYFVNGRVNGWADLGDY